MERRGCVACVCGWGGWRGDFLKADRGSEMEHVAYREISTESSLMNAPLYPCYNGKRRLHDIFFLGNKGCERISDHAQKGCVATLAVRIVHCVKQQNLFVLFTMSDLSHRQCD